jgi:hypothetical protein
VYLRAAQAPIKTIWLTGDDMTSHHHQKLLPTTRISSISVNSSSMYLPAKAKANSKTQEETMDSLEQIFP